MGPLSISRLHRIQFSGAGLAPAPVSERPSPGGLSSPNLFPQYAWPNFAPEWRGNLEMEIMVPLMDQDRILSTGSWEAGFQLTVDRRFLYDSWIFKIGLVFLGS